MFQILRIGTEDTTAFDKVWLRFSTFSTEFRLFLPKQATSFRTRAQTLTAEKQYKVMQQSPCS